MAFATYDECVSLNVHLKYRSGDRCMVCGAHSPLSVTRYVITRKGPDDPIRTLAEPAQGRYTYSTAAAAEALLAELTERANGDSNVFEAFYPNAEVRPVECWPDDFDPKTWWFHDPEFDDPSGVRRLGSAFLRLRMRFVQAMRRHGRL